VQWWVALSMAGHRLRCDCGAWVDVPTVAGEGALSAVVPQELAPVDAQRGVSVDPKVGYSEPTSQYEPVLDVSTSLPMEPGTLQYANAATKRRWTNRGIIELIAVVAAFVVPQIVISINASEEQMTLLMPVSDVIAGVLVLLIGAGAAHYTFSALRAPNSKRIWVEAVVAAAMFLGLAYGWGRLVASVYDIDPTAEMRSLRDVLGGPLGFAVIAIFPAVFEELAFRGLLQGRMSALYGRTGGILLTATAFGLAHGVAPLPIAAGFYLCWMRARCGSLYPAMLVHLLYNGGLYLFGSGIL